MIVTPTALDGVLMIEPRVFTDSRGYFMETFQTERYRSTAGITEHFVQDNLSFSTRGTLRGLHLQHPHDQSKLVQVVAGEIFDVAVDVRPDSSTFGEWVGVVLSGENHRQLFIPQGFAHGFCVTGKSARVLYKTTDYYAPSDEIGILWSDPDLAIDWPVKRPLLSEKDSAYPILRAVPPEKLPRVG